jgi:hypothetical protein
VFSLLAAKSGCNVIAVDAQKEFLDILNRLANLNGVAHLVRSKWAIVAPDAGLFTEPGELSRYNMGQVPPPVTLARVDV